MNQRFTATMKLQCPDYRDPVSLIGRDVCPHCKIQLTTHRFVTPEGHPIKTYHCAAHGDVAPMRSHIVNPG